MTFDEDDAHAWVPPPDWIQLVPLPEPIVARIRPLPLWLIALKKRRRTLRRHA